jgi:hypothetical protein
MHPITTSADFRGIDPDGLAELAATLQAQALAIGHLGSEARTVAAPFRPVDAAGVGSLLARVAMHCESWAGDLARRVELMRIAQQTTPPRSHCDAPDTGSVEAATKAIKNWLSQGLTDWDVTNADLQHVAATLRGLGPSELSAVLLRLDLGAILRWLDEMNGRVNGFSQEEKQRLFAVLAERAAPTALARLAAAVAELRSTEMATDLGSAIARRTPPGHLPQIAAELGAMTRPDDHWAGIVSAHVLEAADTQDVAGSLLAVLLRDASRFLTVIERAGGPPAAVARADGADTKARAFVELVAMLDAPRSWPALLDRIDQSLTDIIESDPDGVLASLAIVHDTDGDHLTRWMRRLVSEAGRLDHLADVVTAASGGGASVDAEWFSAGGGADYPYPHAQNLAYVAASVERALASYAAGAKRRVAALAVLAGVAEAAVSAHAAVTRLVAFAVPSALGGSMALAAGDTVDEIDHDLSRLLAEIDERFEVVGHAPHLGDALAAYDERRDLLLRR